MGDCFNSISITGTIYIGEGIEYVSFPSDINAKRVIMKSMLKDYEALQHFKQIESLWISSSIINSIDDNSMFRYVENVNPIIYTDATENDSNWPDGWNQHNLKVVYETSLDKYKEITD